jgi:hypothetical protein
VLELRGGDVVSQIIRTRCPVCERNSIVAEISGDGDRRHIRYEQGCACSVTPEQLEAISLAVREEWTRLTGRRIAHVHGRSQPTYGPAELT